MASGQAWLDDAAGALWCAQGKAQPLGEASPVALGKRTSAASPNFDATYYHLSLEVRIDPDYLFGYTLIEGRVSGAPLHTLVLDLASNLQVDAVELPSGEALPFSHADDALQITLPNTLAEGEAVAVGVRYQGLPRPEGFGTFVFGRRPGGDPYAWTLSQPYRARGWWPSKDHPSDKADSVRVTVSVPSPLRAGSNGILVAQTTSADGTSGFDWFHRYPISTYLVSLAVGRYDVFEDTYHRPDSLAARHGDLTLPLLHYAYRFTNAYEGRDVFSGWKHVVDVLPVLEHWFGPYPFPDEKYGHAHTTFSGGMEHQTMSSMGRNGIGLVAHELGHMWFGDAVTLRTWPHLWLHEGFATYAELLLYQTRADLYGDTYEDIFDLYYERALEAEGTLVVEDTTSLENLFASPRVYSKGAMVLHMLRQVIGDEAFRTVLQAYATDEAIRFGSATTSDFQRIAEEVSGEDLDAFFRQWVTEGQGEPEYEVRWSSQPAGTGYDVTAEVTQVQSLPASTVEVFEMPITLAMQTAAGERRFTFMNDQRQQTFTFHVDAWPAALVFDPDRALLRHRRVEVVSTEEVPLPPAQTEISALYPNPSGGLLHVRLRLAAPGPVRLDLFDAQGRHARPLLDRSLSAGPHTLSFDLRDLAPGAYFLHLTDGPRTLTRVFTMMRDP